MGKQLIFLCFSISCAVFSLAQVQSGNRVIDFGTIERGSDRIRETQFVNESSKKIFLLRAYTESKEFDIRTDKREVDSGDTLRVRIKLNPLREGQKRDRLELIFGNEDVRIPIKADVRYVDPADNTPCPDFTRGNERAVADWQAYFKVINRDTRAPIKNAEVTISGMSGQSFKAITNAKGEVLMPVPIDYYTIGASHDDYASYTMESYINRRNKDFILELMPGSMGSVVVLRPGAKDKAKPETTEPVVTIEEEEPEPVEELIVEEEPEKSEFSIDEFKPNNVVFLVDISTSMRQEERIELLKSSMIRLAEMLRPQDVISLVTYATHTEVVISGEHVSDSQKIAEVIEALEAEGKTAGEAGLKQAYSLCKRHFLEDGNNQVFIATDGAFNKGSDKIKKLVKSKAKKDMYLSVLSIRSSKWVDKKMLELAQAGNGQHLSIKEIDDQDKLSSLVKEQSRR